MSLFSSREWWTTRLGDSEEFDQGSLCVANIDGDPSGAGARGVGAQSSVPRRVEQSADGARAQSIQRLAALQQLGPSIGRRHGPSHVGAHLPLPNPTRPGRSQARDGQPARRPAHTPPARARLQGRGLPPGGAAGGGRAADRSGPLRRVRIHARRCAPMRCMARMRRRGEGRGSPSMATQAWVERRVSAACVHAGLQAGMWTYLLRLCSQRRLHGAVACHGSPSAHGVPCKHTAPCAEPLAQTATRPLAAQQQCRPVPGGAVPSKGGRAQVPGGPLQLSAGRLCTAYRRASARLLLCMFASAVAAFMARPKSGELTTYRCCTLQMTRLFEHPLEHTAANMAVGAFGSSRAGRCA